jgi:monoamine oxidase
MHTMDCDVVIVGAGVAGLSAAAVLKKAGVDVRCLEAGNRLGGRILTFHDPLSPLPIELGAEFIHGRPPEIWDLIRGNGLTAFEHSAEALHLERGRIVDDHQAGEAAEDILEQMKHSERRHDETFEEYLRHSQQPADVKNWARVYVEGFNAARKEDVSAASLTQDAVAADRIEGDRSFRLIGGYDSIVAALLRSIPEHESTIQLNAMVKKIVWRAGSAQVHYQSRLDGQAAVVRCREVIVTVPLGVLQAAPASPGAILFDPEPGGILKAAKSLRFGQVYRVTFRFRSAFWEEDDRLKSAGFFISQDKQFFTWWTTHPILTPLLTGWMAGSAAERFRSADTGRIAAEALASLSRILHRKIPAPDAMYFHNWRTDPFFRGAYSYMPANALPARRTLAEPVQGTLFFAGEATELNGHSATVHGAIASGTRAAQSLLAERKRFLKRVG